MIINAINTFTISHIYIGIEGDPTFQNPHNLLEGIELAKQQSGTTMFPLNDLSNGNFLNSHYALATVFLPGMLAFEILIDNTLLVDTCVDGFTCYPDGIDCAMNFVVLNTSMMAKIRMAQIKHNPDNKILLFAVIDGNGDIEGFGYDVTPEAVEKLGYVVNPNDIIGNIIGINTATGEGFLGGEYKDAMGLPKEIHIVPKLNDDFTMEMDFSSFIRALPDEVFEKLEGIMNENKSTRSIRPNVKIGRNEPCHCGSGRKYKNCCIN